MSLVSGATAPMSSTGVIGKASLVTLTVVFNHSNKTCTFLKERMSNNKTLIMGTYNYFKIIHWYMLFLNFFVLACFLPKIMLTNLCASGDSSSSEHVSMKSLDDLASAGESIGLVDC